MNKPIAGGLEAAASIGKSLENLIIFNSLSKSNACGMRAGFIAGDEKIIQNYKLLVSNGVTCAVTNSESCKYVV